MQRFIACLGLIAALACVSPGAAQSRDGTLGKIEETKTIVIGYREDEPPFSYVMPDGTATGYSIELCQRVVAGLQRHLGLDHIKIVYMPATAATRFVLLKSGKIDIECAATTNNAERRKQVDFSFPHYMTATQFLSRRSEQLKTVQDLSGRSVAAPSGTVGIDQLNAINRSEKLNIAIMPTKSNEDAFNLVASGRASAFVTDGIILAAFIANAPDPDSYVLSEDALSDPEPYGLMMRRGDDAFKTVVNATLRPIFQSDEIVVLYKKWFMSPMPSSERNLNLPMSGALQAVFRDPADLAN